MNTCPLVTILLVEDDSLDAEMFRRQLLKQQRENPLVRATDGLEALDILLDKHPDKHIAEPVLIALDINLPRMNGLEFLAALEESPEAGKHSIFVMVSAEPDKAMFRGLDESIDGFIRKSELGEDLGRCIEQHERLGQAIVAR